MSLQLVHSNNSAPVAFCFRHPDRPAERVVAGDGFCHECWKDESVKGAPPVAVETVTLPPAILRPRRKPTRGPGRPKGSKDYKAKTRKPFLECEFLGDVTRYLFALKTWDRPILVPYSERTARSLRSGLHEYAFRYGMKWATESTDEG
ncbi:MAG TPA: hypothetical protein VLA89_17295, partial [Gemmatimonadales bacterium]|nr:hypothetical protein [Gemmatimonadales bacterium]